MNTRRRFLIQSVTSTIDQAMLSGLNLLVGLVLIRYTTKETYGIYSQLFGIGLLSTSLLDAMIRSALTTMAGQLDADRRGSLVARTARIEWVAATALAIIAGFGLWLVASRLNLSENTIHLALSFAAFIFLMASREYCRTALFIDSRPNMVAWLDFVFVIATLSSLAFALWVGPISVTLVMLLLAASNGIAAALYSFKLMHGVGSSSIWQVYLCDIRSLWALSKWALAGATLAWIGNNCYMYFVAEVVGVEALADVNAARLLLAPIFVVGMAWTRVARPAMGLLIASSDSAALDSFVKRSFMALEGIIAVYLMILLGVLPSLTVHVLGAKYRDLSTTLVLWWGCYFAISTARGIGTAVLTSLGAYQALFWQSLISVLFLLLAWWWSIPRFGVTAAVLSMFIVEFGRLIDNHAYQLPRARRSQRL